MRRIKVSKKGVGIRADTFVTSQLKKFSRSSLKALFKNSSVKVNNKIAKSGYKLREGDSVVVDTGLLNKKPAEIDLPIIYEDDDVIVINKPSGILSHSKGAIIDEPTVATFIRPMVGKELSGNRAGIVHRLDRGTSGLIITAKHKLALERLQKQFSEHKTTKHYLAIAEGRIEISKAIIDAPISRNPRQPKKFKVSVLGKPAQTKYEVLRVFSHAGKSYSYLKLTPVSGRTHQIRVHLSYIGHPVVGDAMYGRDEPIGLLLHAESLELTLPNGKTNNFKAPIPDRIKNFMKDNSNA